MAHQLPIQIVRPPSVIGEDDPYMLSLFKVAKRGWVVMPGWSNYRYSMIHLEDLVRAIPHVAQCRHVRISDSDSGIVHLAQVPALQFAETAQIVREHFGGHRVREIHLPASLCWTVAAVNSFAARLLPVSPLLNLDKIREGLAGDWIADPTRLTEELGFRFPNSIHDRIVETVEGYHKKGWL